MNDHLSRALAAEHVADLSNAAQRDRLARDTRTRHRLSDRAGSLVKFSRALTVKRRTFARS
jgi:hypothetical protein